MQSIIQYRSLWGSTKSNLENASQVYIVEERENEKTVYGIADLYKQELESGQLLYIFMFEQRKFYYNSSLQAFTRLKPKV